MTIDGRYTVECIVTALSGIRTECIIYPYVWIIFSEWLLYRRDRERYTERKIDRSERERET